ncbi:hypothetical protein [Niastella sp. OAS944]|uniref:hypothetical protein n=1 Tax=Niastella sp. OAS944 TaxID=2664089 RepID=UPI00347CAA46|nr:hypothetical protein [Chitinophagaceae bacterium OAS944]
MHQQKNTVPLKQIVFLLLITAAGTVVRAQQVDSIFFHLYTDSLKKGTHNYINVDGKMSNGRWQPLTNKEIDFTSSYGKFEGNSLIIDTAFKGEKVTVKAVLKNNTAIWKEATIYIKKVEIVERLRTVDEILNTPSNSSRKSRRGLVSGL